LGIAHCQCWQIIDEENFVGQRRDNNESTEEGRQQSREVTQQGQQKASEYAQQGREQAKGQIATQKERASGELHGISQALQKTAEQLKEQDQEPIGRYADQASEQAEKLSNYLSGRDAEQLLNEAEDLARNKPAIFLGGAFVIGVAAARFLKSSAGQREEFDARQSAKELGSAATGKDLESSSDGGSESGGDEVPSFQAKGRTERS